jgi:hypothetical protein
MDGSRCPSTSRTIGTVTSFLSRLVEEAPRLPTDDRIRLVEQILAI